MLLGLPVLHRLLQRPDAKLWPFETNWDKQLDGVVLAELWPSLFDISSTAHPIKDACQVLASVRWMHEHGPAGLARPASMDREEEARVMAGEGWILGLGWGETGTAEIGDAPTRPSNREYDSPSRSPAQAASKSG